MFDDGVKGLLLFLCFSEIVIGVRNLIIVICIEEKMGLYVLLMCQMVFDGVEVQLIGCVGGGFVVMFMMMNYVCIDVVLQGVVYVLCVYDIVYSYVVEWVQGCKFDCFDVMLIDYVDVVWMLDDIDILVVGVWVIVYLCIVILEEGKNFDFMEFLILIVKVVGLEVGICVVELGMQVLGGYGYLWEYCLE